MPVMSPPVCVMVKFWLALAAGILDADHPGSADGGGRARRHRRIGIMAGIAHGRMHGIGNDAVFARIHHVRHDGDRAGHLVGAAAGAAIQQDARRAGIQLGPQFGAGDAQHLGVPAHAQARRLVGKILGLQIFEAGGLQRLQPRFDSLHPAAPHLLLGGMVALVPLASPPPAGPWSLPCCISAPGHRRDAARPGNRRPCTAPCCPAACPEDCGPRRHLPPE